MRNEEIEVRRKKKRKKNKKNWKKGNTLNRKEMEGMKNLRQRDGWIGEERKGRE